MAIGLLPMASFATPQVPQRKRRGLLDFLGDRFVPGLEDPDQKAAVRQGLLQLAAGIQSSRNLGEGLSQGLLAASQGFGSARKDAREQGLQERLLALREQQAQQGGGLPAQAQYVEWLASRLPENEREGVYRYFGGLKSRDLQDTYTYEQQETEKGPVTWRQSRLGVREYQDPDTGQWINPNPSAGVPFGDLRNVVEQIESGGDPNAVSPVGAVGRMQTMPGTLQDPGFGVTPARDQSDAERTRVGNEYLGAMVGRYEKRLAPAQKAALAAYNWGPGNFDKALDRAGGDVDAAIASSPKETRDYIARAEGRLGAPRPLSKAELAAQEAAAKAQVELGVLPQTEAIKTRAEVDRAAQVTAAQEAAKTQAEAAKNLPKAIQQADEALHTIDLLEKHPGLSLITGMTGKLYPEGSGINANAEAAHALAQQIEGQTFLQAFESLKGAGQITEVEGQKATQAKARLNRAQGAKDYKAALKDLKDVIATSRARAQRAAQGVGSESGGVDELLSKYGVR